jgi:hypothetical protein
MLHKGALTRPPVMAGPAAAALLCTAVLMGQCVWRGAANSTRTVPPVLLASKEGKERQQRRRRRRKTGEETQRQARLREKKHTKKEKHKDKTKDREIQGGPKGGAL